jgi:hypothetical protein
LGAGLVALHKSLDSKVLFDVTEAKTPYGLSDEDFRRSLKAELDGFFYNPTAAPFKRLRHITSFPNATRRVADETGAPFDSLLDLTSDDNPSFSGTQSFLRESYDVPDGWRILFPAGVLRRIYQWQHGAPIPSIAEKALEARLAAAQRRGGDTGSDVPTFDRESDEEPPVADENEDARDARRKRNEEARAKRHAAVEANEAASSRKRNIGTVNDDNGSVVIGAMSDPRLQAVARVIKLELADSKGVEVLFWMVRKDDLQDIALNVLPDGLRMSKTEFKGTQVYDVRARIHQHYNTLHSTAFPTPTKVDYTDYMVEVAAQTKLKKQQDGAEAKRVRLEQKASQLGTKVSVKGTVAQGVMKRMAGTPKKGRKSKSQQPKPRRTDEDDEMFDGGNEV